MNPYKSYMDRVAVSDELHETLLHLEKPAKKPVRWQKYAAAACAVLLVGVGAWHVGTRQNPERWRDLVATFDPYDAPSPVPCTSPSAPVESSAAIETDPMVEGDDILPGMKTIGGYETREIRAGVDVAVYHVLPWIDYGTDNSAAALDWALPEGVTQKDLSVDEIVAFLGSSGAVEYHLDWSGYELTGWAAWYEDGSLWGVYLMGYKGPLDHFEFAVTLGQLPPSCIVFAGSVEQDIWGVTVTADKYDGEDGCSRRVSFMKEDYGYRFDLTATGEPEAAEKLVSRLVTYIAVGDGLDLRIVTPAPSASDVPTECPAGVLPGWAVSPAEAPNYSVGEPNWNDGSETPATAPPQDGASAPSVPPASAN